MSWGRRRRTTYHSPWRTTKHPLPPTAPKWDDKTWAESTAPVAAFEEHTRLLERILSSKPALTWNSPKQVAESLRFLLATYRRCLEWRGLLTSAASTMQSVICYNHSTYTTPQPDMSRGNGNEETREASAFTASAMRPEDAIRIYEGTQDWNKLVHQAHQDWVQLQTLLVLPEYLTIKKHLLRIKNGVRAYATLLACQTGKLDRNLSSQHKLFGWYETGYDAERILHNLQWMSRNIWSEENPVIKKKKKVVRDRLHPLNGQEMSDKIDHKIRMTPPSILMGREILSQALRAEATARPKKNISERLMDIIVSRDNAAVHTTMGKKDMSRAYAESLVYKTSLYRRLDAAKLAGSVSSMTPSMIYRCIRTPLLEQAVIPTKIALKIMRPQETPPTQSWTSNNNVTTLLTGPVERVYASDYRAPCIYNHNGNSTEGYVLMRKGYPDMVHISLLEPQNLTQEAISRRLDQVSGRYFKDKNSAYEKSLTQSQRIARILKRCRHLPELTRQDSYSVGNCIPGTENFIRSLNLMLDEKGEARKAIDGKALARKWRNKGSRRKRHEFKAGGCYSQDYLFGNVVHHLYERHQEYIQAQQQESLISKALNHLVGEGHLVAMQYEAELELRREVDAAKAEQDRLHAVRVYEELSTGNLTHELPADELSRLPLPLGEPTDAPARPEHADHDAHLAGGPALPEDGSEASPRDSGSDETNPDERGAVPTESPADEGSPDAVLYREERDVRSGELQATV